MSAYQIGAVAIMVVGLLVALGLLTKGARGSSRGWAVTGTVLIFVGVLSGFAYQALVQRFVGRVDTETIVSILAADLLIGGLLTGAGMLLVTRAIVVATRTTPS